MLLPKKHLEPLSVRAVTMSLLRAHLGSENTIKSSAVNIVVHAIVAVIYELI